MIKAHQMKNGGMHIMNMNFALFREEAVIISCAMRVPTLNSTARKPHGETLRVVIPAIATALGSRSSTKFPAPPNKSVF